MLMAMCQSLENGGVVEMKIATIRKAQMMVAQLREINTVWARAEIETLERLIKALGGQQ